MAECRTRVFVRHRCCRRAMRSAKFVSRNRKEKNCHFPVSARCAAGASLLHRCLHRVCHWRAHHCVGAFAIWPVFEIVESWPKPNCRSSPPPPPQPLRSSRSSAIAQHEPLTGRDRTRRRKLLEEDFPSVRPRAQGPGQDEPATRRAETRMAQVSEPRKSRGPVHTKHLKSQVGLLLVPALLLLTALAPGAARATKCYFCLFQLARCTSPLDCYNQPDTCSNTNFSPVLSPSIDCEFGCEQHVITDATGAIVLWQRGCAEDRSPKSSYVCLSGNFFFLRHEQCWCHTDYCNSTLGRLTTIKDHYIIVTISLLATLAMCGTLISGSRIRVVNS